jgi:redox-sensitive bicupin YhaK (pirin superfamily)
MRFRVSAVSYRRAVLPLFFRHFATRSLIRQEMLMQIRRSQERGFADHGWLKSYHTFSFADYYDPRHVQFGPLRVINEDRVQAGAGFGTHGHRDMEIISYVLSGELAHKDSLGNGSTIKPGDVQRMSAGTGVRHSEFNPSSSHAVHFLQIWIQPRTMNLPPSYQEKRFEELTKRGRLQLIASPEGGADSVLLHQDARIYAGLFDGGERAEFAVSPGRSVYLHVARGTISVNGVALNAGDAMSGSDTASLRLENGAAAEVLLFDLHEGS